MIMNSNIDLFCGIKTNEFVYDRPLKTKARRPEDFIKLVANMAYMNNKATDQEIINRIYAWDVNIIQNVFLEYFDKHQGYAGGFDPESKYTHAEPFVNLEILKQYMDMDGRTEFDQHVMKLRNYNGFIYLETFLVSNPDEFMPKYCVLYFDESDLPKYYIPLCGNVMMCNKSNCDFSRDRFTSMYMLMKVAAVAPQVYEKMKKCKNMDVQSYETSKEKLDAIQQNEYAKTYIGIHNITKVSGMDFGKRGWPTFESVADIERFAFDDLYYYLEWDFGRMTRDIFSHLIFV